MITVALKQEWPLLPAYAMTLWVSAFARTAGDLSDPVSVAMGSAALLLVIGISIFAVVRHAEILALWLGEPLGTLVLTLAITGVEVMIIVAAMSTGDGHPTLARDAMLSVVMIVLNAMVGITLLLGAMRYHEQDYNLQGANAFLAVILPLSVIGLVIPNFTRSSPDQTFSTVQATFVSLIFLAFYAVFLAIQNVRHRAYFQSSEPRTTVRERGSISPWLSAVLLFVYIAPLVFLSEQIAGPMEFFIRQLKAPPAIAGLVVAALILAPESAAAIRAALSNDLQRSVNILLGSVLASTGLTIPAVLVFGLITSKPIVLGIDPVDVTLLALTLVLSTMTFSSSRTNVLLGAVHLLLFLAYVLLIFQR